MVPLYFIKAVGPHPTSRLVQSLEVLLEIFSKAAANAYRISGTRWAVAFYSTQSSPSYPTQFVLVQIQKPWSSIVTLKAGGILNIGL